jgi:hypothetical protein
MMASGGEVRPMKSRSQTRVGTFTFLVFLMLLAFAAGAQAALAAHFSNGSAVTTPAAGTEGRGGVDAGTATVAVVSTAPTAGSTSPAAGTQGRGGASLTVAAVSPVAGTQGRGGVASAGVTSTQAATTEVATTAGDTAVAENGFVSRARGGFPGGPMGVQRAIVESSGASTSTGWIAAGIALAVLAIAAFFVWAASRRRRWQQESSLAQYCQYHPADSLC